MATILSELRSLAPLRPLTINEGLSIAERQATKLLDALGLKEPPVPELAIAGLPKVQVERASPIPVSGSSQWIAGRWLIMLNAAEPMVRQRFSLGHEFKHVIDHGSTLIHFANSGGFRVHDRAEQICDYFSACLLMPRSWVKRAYCAEGIQQVSTLARRFGVSVMAMQVRLIQLGLVDPPARCQPPRYLRLLPVEV